MSVELPDPDNEFRIILDKFDPRVPAGGMSFGTIDLSSPNIVHRGEIIVGYEHLSPRVFMSMSPEGEPETVSSGIEMQEYGRRFLFVSTRKELVFQSMEKTETGWHNSEMSLLEVSDLVTKAKKALEQNPEDIEFAKQYDLLVVASEEFKKSKGVPPTHIE